jgi:uncharacterized protein (TIGR00730 family)
MRERSPTFCVFCGSSSGTEPHHAEAARAFGVLLAEAGCDVVYGGGHVGLMGILADAALGAGGKVFGVIPQRLVDRELAHRGLTELHVVSTMHERKALMASLSDGFIALPGGIGTLEEFFEVWTWAQLGYHEKPLGLLDVNGFFSPLIAFLERASELGFIPRSELKRVKVESDPSALLERMDPRLHDPQS